MALLRIIIRNGKRYKGTRPCDPGTLDCPRPDMNQTNLNLPRRSEPLRCWDYLISCHEGPKKGWTVIHRTGKRMNHVRICFWSCCQSMKAEGKWSTKLCDPLFICVSTQDFQEMSQQYLSGQWTASTT